MTEFVIFLLLCTQFLVLNLLSVSSIWLRMFRGANIKLLINRFRTVHSASVTQDTYFYDNSLLLRKFSQCHNEVKLVIDEFH